MYSVRRQDDQLMWKIWWTENGNSGTKLEKSRPNATFSTTNHTQPNMGLNPGPSDGKPATNRLSYEYVTAVCFFDVKVKGKSIPVRAHGGPQGFETSRLPHFLDNRLIDDSKFASLQSQSQSYVTTDSFVGQSVLA
jgi:hypothetical protein